MAKHKKKKKTGKKKKDDFDKRLEKGIRSFSEEDYDKAGSIFGAVLKTEPDNFKISAMLAETIVRKGNMEEGKARYREVFSGDGDLWASWRLASLLSQGKDNEGSETVLKECIEKNSSNPWAYLNLASFYRKREELDKAMEVLDRATSCAAELPVLWGLVQILLEHDPSPEITGQLSKFLILIPKHWLDYYLLSRCFIRQEQYDKALEVQNKSTTFIKNEMSSIPRYLYPCYSKMLGYVYLQKSMIAFLSSDFDEVVSAGLNVLRHNGNLLEARYLLGVGYLYQGLLDKGRNSLLHYIKEIHGLEDDKLKEIHGPAVLSAKLLTGQSYITQSAFNEAIEIYKEIIEEKPEIVEAYLNAGYGYYCLGNIESSKEMFKSLLDLKNDNLVALNNLGFLEMHNRNFEAAKDYFRKAIEVASDYPLPYANLGFILTVEGDYREGEEILLKALNVKEPEEASLKVIYPYSREESVKMGGAPIEENKTISSHVASLCNLGTSLARRKNYRGAHLCFDKLIECLPQLHYGYRGKAWVSFLENDIQAAGEYMKKAFQTNSDNKVLYEEYNFIKSKEGEIAETRKMASVLEGFFTSQEDAVSDGKDYDVKEIVDKIEMGHMEAFDNGDMWAGLLIDKIHLLSQEKNINKLFEEEFKLLEMISSWRNVEIASEDKNEISVGG